MRRVTELLREDLGALVPGTNVRWDRQVALRLLLYVALGAFIAGLFLNLRGTDRRGPRPRTETPRMLPPAESIPDSHSI